MAGSGKDELPAVKTSDLFVRALENEGVKYVFGIPGEENLDFLNSLKDSRIKLVLTRHEQAAGFMAATVGRITGKCGVALSTLGPGATNFATAAAYAQLAGFPMLMVTGQKPVRQSKQGSFQIVDIVDLMKQVTKFAKQIADGDLVPSLVRESIRVAEEERPGAVHLELPEDIAKTMSHAHIFPVYQVRRPVAEEKSIAKAVAMIQAAHRPLLLIGAGANRKRTQNMLREFVDEIGIPFVTTQMGKGVVTERSPLYCGCAALSVADFANVCLEKADLVIVVGHDVVEKPPFFMKYQQAPYVIHVNFYSAKVDNVYFPQHEVVGDIANAVWQIKERVAKQQHWDFSYFLESRAQMLDHFKIGQDDDRFPLIPQRIVHDVRQVMPDDGVVALDNGMYKIWFARLYAAVEPNTLLLDNALATMGAGLPSAMAVSLLNPDKKVLAVAGDGGFMMNSQELETCVRLNLNITVAVVNDSGFGMIKWKQKAEGLPKFGLEYGNPDFVAYAEAYGMKGYRVNAAKELLPLLKKVMSEPGPKLIEIPIAYDEANELLDKELPGKLQKQASVPKTPIPDDLKAIVEGSKPIPLSMPKTAQTPGEPQITQDTARSSAFLKSRDHASPPPGADSETPKTVPKSTSQI